MLVLAPLFYLSSARFIVSGLRTWQRPGLPRYYIIHKTLEHLKIIQSYPPQLSITQTTLSTLFLNSKTFQLSQYVRGKTTDHHAVSSYDPHNGSDLFCIW